MPDPVDSIKYPAVGVAVIIQQQRRILIGRRIKPPMSSSWQLPGGWLRMSESPEQAIERQLLQFKGMKFESPRFVSYSNNVFNSQVHSVSLYFMTRCSNANQLQLNENRQCSEWVWAEWNNLPQPLFLPLQLLKQSGFDPFTPE